jgi:serine/threonine protein kinase
VPTQPSEDVNEEDLFAAALALPVIERDKYLWRACGTDIVLLERLKDLVGAFGNAASFMNEDIAIAGPSNRIGPYQVLRELGEGGCGVAYLVDQIAPVKRQAALKVIKPGMDTKAVMARFEAERQALGMLDHPNIAKVFDAGATGEGRPYFVMELVRGIRITEYCTQVRLTIPERLSLFIQVCQAILHAHQKGIIHRDIKPSNVLVTIHDSLPVAKVIDFGIAKALQGRLIDETLNTEIDQIMGTPAYISPEQARSTHAAVDTRSDVYSLGVLLYELLTGHTPFDAHELAEASIERFRERICTEEPARPSRRLNALSNELVARVAASSGTTATKLVNQIRDDLDWIVMQCLDKDPSRRYQAVNELIADIDRYLRHQPVLARPPSFNYLVRKFARRNRVAFASALAGAVFLLFIGAFAIALALQAQRITAERDLAQRERQRAQKVSNVALNVLSIADPFQNAGKDVSGPALLDHAAKSIERELTDQPEARARLLQAIGRAYLRRGDFRSSTDYLKEASRVLTQLQGAEREAMMATIDLSVALRIGGDLRGAREALVIGDQIAKRSALERTSGYAKLLLNRGRIEVTESRIADARTDIERSLHLFEETAGPRTVEVAEASAELAQIFIWTDDHALAEQTVRAAIDIFDRTVSPMYPDRVSAEKYLAEALYLQNRLDEAASLLVGALQKTTELFGNHSAEVADVLDRLAIVKYAQHDYGEAQRYSRAAVTAARSAHGDSHVIVANVATTLARTLAENGNHGEAEAALTEALGIYTAVLPPDHQYIASTEFLLGEVLLATHRPREAEVVLIASVKRWKRSGAPPWRAARSASALGEALYRQGRTQEAERYLSDSFHQLSADSTADLPAKEKARERFERYVRKPPSPKRTPIPGQIAAQ